MRKIHCKPCGAITARRCAALALSVLLALGSPAFAGGIGARDAGSRIDKDETVYFLLDPSGAPERAIVVNAAVAEDSSFVDRGVYSKIQNLSSAAQPATDGDRIVFSGLTAGEKFFYRGELESAESPWLIGITYRLGGVPIGVSELPGAKGRLEITIDVSKNPDAPGDYAATYALQVSGVIRTPLRGAQTDGLNLVTIGSAQHLAGVVLPNLAKTMTLSADVDGFEMDALTFTGIRAELGSDFDMSEVTDGISAIDSGSSQVLGGLVQLRTGIGAAAEGVRGISGGLSDLSAAGEQMRGGIRELQAGSEAIAAAGAELRQGTERLVGALRSGAAQMTEVAAIAEQLLASPDPAVQAAANALLAQARSSGELLGALETLSQGQNRYIEGVSAALEAQKQLASGQIRMIEGIGALAKGARTLDGRFGALAQGVRDLVEGQTAFVEGVGEAKIRLEGLMESVGLGGNESVYSFVRPEYEVRSVQFILRTPEIKKPAPKPEPAPPKVKNSLWNQIMKLFQ